MATEGGKQQNHKTHRVHKSGASAKKKHQPNLVTSSATDDTDPKASDANKKKMMQQKRHQNPKASTFNSSVKAKKLQARTTEKEQKRLHLPTIDRSTGEPTLFAVVV